MVKIRLARHGVKKRPFYKIIIADSRFPINGRFIEKIGFFNPIASGKAEKLFIKIDRLKYWQQQGAQLSKKINFLIKKQTKNKL
ncbi:30S ribosomal protein S16 [Buchnera aphidicola (Eriosoma grossulariae)]|uniref:30S ribosomal protein S16 n=1 Tax=Buchnera aphidicola TaxID=9 RepID=UPI003464CBF0